MTVALEPQSFVRTLKRFSCTAPTAPNRVALKRTIGKKSTRNLLTCVHSVLG
jgi:hypothetical protein